MIIVEFHDNNGVTNTFDYRIKARNGRVRVQSNQGFTRYEDCVRAWRSFQKAADIPDELVKYKSVFKRSEVIARYGSD